MINKGDVIKPKKNTIHSSVVLAVCDELYAISRIGQHDIFDKWCTENDIMNNFNLPVKKRFLPVRNQKVFYITSGGKIQHVFFEQGYNMDDNLFKIGNAFATKKEAEKMASKIISILQSNSGIPPEESDMEPVTSEE